MDGLGKFRFTILLDINLILSPHVFPGGIFSQSSPQDGEVDIS